MRIKLLAAAAVTIAAAMCGRSMAQGAQRRLHTILELLDGLRRLRIQMVERLEPLSRALAQTGSPILSAVSELLNETVGAYAAWQILCRRERARGGKLDGLTAREFETLDQMFERLGASGRNDQAQIIENCLAALEDSKREAQERAAQAARLYPTVGGLLGLMLAVLTA